MEKRQKTRARYRTSTPTRTPSPKTVPGFKCPTEVCHATCRACPRPADNQQVIFVVNADPEADMSIPEARTYAGEDPPFPSLDHPASPSILRDPFNDRKLSLPGPTGIETLSSATSSDHYMLSPQSFRPASHGHMHGVPTERPPLLERQSTNGSGPILSPLSTTHSVRPINDLTLPPLTPSFSSHIEQLRIGKDSPAIPDESESNYEAAFLLRHFTEIAGPWMDLFDIHKYFTNYVPVKAMTNPILRNAACAYASKQLSRVHGRRPIMGGAASTQAPSEIIPDGAPADWAFKATQYYDKAIELLMQGIRDGVVGVNREDENQIRYEELTSHTTSAMGDKRKVRSFSDSQMPTYQWKKRRKVSEGRALSDEMTAATAILCDYELQERSGSEWQHHLDGTKSLLDIVEGTMMPLQAPLATPRPPLSRARQATFWNFARQDFLSALISETQTRLDSEDLPMWRDAGLDIDENGFIRPSNMSAHGLPEGPNAMKEDMISNALIWIMDKIVNYALAAGTGPCMGRLSLDQAALHGKWLELKAHLELWFTGLPDSFKPCAVLPAAALPRHLQARYGPDGPVFSEIWYNNPMCASTMQSYHTARMLLLINMPQQSRFSETAYRDRLAHYKSVPQEIEAHARAICGIASSRPEGAVRVHSVQPLFIAGQSLNTAREKRELLKLLIEIEHDTGWATEYRVRRLCEEWEWPTIDGPAEDHHENGMLSV